MKSNRYELCDRCKHLKTWFEGNSTIHHAACELNARSYRFPRDERPYTPCGPAGERFEQRREDDD